ncbi:hypothetical protein C8R46DRAFT_1300004 [Mycena filopes]|nr:hypothetical protein C8R46DRAFT_1300004 [Mycena filopes]
MGDPLRDDSWPMLAFAKGVTMSILHNPLRTHIVSTGEETLSVPAHWHRYQEEQHTVLKGRVKLTQDGVTRIITPADGPVLTRRGVVHSLATFPGEEVVVDEMALPSEELNEQKIIFFRNLCAPGIVESLLGTMQVFYWGDSYPEIPLHSRTFEKLFVVVVGGWIAPLLGHKLPDNRLRMDPERFPPGKKNYNIPNISQNPGKTGVPCKGVTFVLTVEWKRASVLVRPRKFKQQNSQDDATTKGKTP